MSARDDTPFFLGSTPCKDINPGSVGMIGTLDTDASILGGELFFNAQRDSDPNHGNELWKTDGSTSGTVLVKDINPIGSSDPGRFAEFNSKLSLRSWGGFDKSLPILTGGSICPCHPLPPSAFTRKIFPQGDLPSGRNKNSAFVS